MKIITRSLRRLFALCSCSLLLIGCSTPDGTTAPEALRVGLTPDLPPLVFLQKGELKGLEVDLARELAVALGCPVEVSRLPWKGLMKALQNGQIDVVMGGVTITEARKLQVAFTEPILESGLAALIRATDRETFTSKEKLQAYGGQIGFLPNTTSEAFVKRTFPRARHLAVDTAEDAALLLDRRGLDAFVNDLPALVWMHSRNAAKTALIPEALQREPIAWAVRRDDQALLDQINTTLAAWRKDGSLTATIQRWMPYYQQLLDAKP
jgi:ABC-type amino acid transport substrate-binding protein